MTDIKSKIKSVLSGGDILFVVPSFVTTRTPIMGPHILQSIARDHGYRTDILHLNVLLASVIGFDLYEQISYGQPYLMLGERLFARSAYGLPPLGQSPEVCLDPAASVFGQQRNYPMNVFEYKYYRIADFDMDTFLNIEDACHRFMEEVIQTISGLNYKMVGCSSNWEQNNCSVSLLNGLKEKQPDIITLIGGSNCEGQMAEGIASLSDSIDYIFDGESEHTFSGFLDTHSTGKLPNERIIVGEPVEDIDKIPLPDYESYFTQMDTFLADKNTIPTDVLIGYEASRGCWYGKCSFCGMNGKRMCFRKKNAQKVVTELEEVNNRYPGKRVFMLDKLFPTSFQSELLPLLCDSNSTPHITSEHRPGLKLDELIRLKEAKIDILKFGIESLSTGLLKLMKKGVYAWQNILLLRNARCIGLFVDWNLLWGFPADKADFYKETLELIPFLHHLDPPSVFRHLSLDRFCSYYENPEEHAIDSLRPWEVYKHVFPDWADVEKVAYRFTGDYPCEAHDHPELINNVADAIENWRKARSKSKLVMLSFADYYIVYDNRALVGKEQKHVLSLEQAKTIMNHGLYDQSADQLWAIEHKLAVVKDSRYVPLVTASPELLFQLGEESSRN